MPDTLLIIEDNRLLATELKRHYTGQEWDVLVAESATSARAILADADNAPLVVLSDMNLPDGNGLDLLEECRERKQTAEWVFLTGYGSVTDSVRALRLGASDYLEKPCEQDRLDVVVNSAARSATAQRRLSGHTRAISKRYTPAAFLGQSAAAREVREMLSRLTEVPFSSLVIAGETGTGKGLAARILHHSGSRAEEPLVEVNCAALPASLIESELFGNEAGAFTGAKGRRRGLFEQANGGSLFLDEIGEMDVEMQSKLLSVIEDRQIRRLGGDKSITVDVQLLAATNRNLEKQVRDGEFRADLFHRLSAFQVKLPSLRERREDMRDLVESMVQEFNVAAGRQVREIPDAVWSALESHDWPGNIRELRNVVERCVLFAEDEVFPARWLQLPGAGGAPSTAQVEDGRVVIPLDGSIALDDMDRLIIRTALERSDHNVTAAARLLGTTRETLRYRVQKYDLKPGED